MNEMTRDEALDFLASQEVGHIGVLDDEPYVSPLSYVVDDGTLYFRTLEGRRLSAITAKPRVCIETSEVAAGSWSSVCAWGDAEVIDDANLEADIVTLLLNKYAESSESVLSFAKSPELGRPAKVVAVPLDTVSGRRSGPELGTQIRPGSL